MFWFVFVFFVYRSSWLFGCSHASDEGERSELDSICLVEFVLEFNPKTSRWFAGTIEDAKHVRNTPSSPSSSAHLECSARILATRWKWSRRNPPRYQPQCISRRTPSLVDHVPKIEPIDGGRRQCWKSILDYIIWCTQHELDRFDDLMDENLTELELPVTMSVTMGFGSRSWNSIGSSTMA